MSGTVHVVDDDSSVRDSISYLMQSVNLKVLTYESATEFLDKFQDEAASCLVLDLRMPDVSGLETLQLIKSRGIQIPVIVITGHGDVPVAVRAMRLGAVDLLEKPCNDQLLLERVQQSLQHDTQRRAEQSEIESVRLAIGALSARETEVMELIVSGKSNKETALALGVSPKTIETHRANVMRKLSVESLAELVQAVVSIRSRTTVP